MSGQPTGEWTQEWLRQYLAGYSSYDLQLKAIAAAHKAAVAEATDTEREKRENSDRKWIVAAGQLRQQLAAERGKVAAIQAGMKSLIKKWLTKTPSTWDSAYINTWNECASDLENAFMDTK